MHAAPKPNLNGNQPNTKTSIQQKINASGNANEEREREREAMVMWNYGIMVICQIVAFV